MRIVVVFIVIFLLVEVFLAGFVEIFLLIAVLVEVAHAVIRVFHSTKPLSYTPLSLAIYKRFFSRLFEIKITTA